MKKFLAAVAALAISATAFSGVAMAANDYGSPKMNGSFSVDGQYIDLKMNWSDFEGFKEYSTGRTGTQGVGVAAITLKINYPSDQVVYQGGEKMNISAGMTKVSDSGAEQAVISGAYPADALLTNPTQDFCTFWFEAKQGVDPSKDKIEFTVDVIEFVIRDLSGAKVDEYYGNSNNCKNYGEPFAEAGPYVLNPGEPTPPAPTTYAITKGENVTITGAEDLTAVPENTVLTVTAADNYDLYKDGVKVDSPYEYTVTAAAAFTAVKKASDYGYSIADKGTVANGDAKGIYYTLFCTKIDAGKLTLSTAEKSFEMTNVPNVTSPMNISFIVMGVEKEAAPSVTGLVGQTATYEMLDK